MAQIIKCRVCKKNVSNEALSCPHCGDPYVTEERKRETEERKREREGHEALQNFRAVRARAMDMIKKGQW